MKLLQAAAMAALALSAASASGSNQWKPTTAPLMTRWAKDVSPDNALPDYPRPQMVRREWKNLNGLWQFAPATGEGEAPPVGRELSERILVPYPPESALSGIGRHNPRVWYRRTFETPAEWRGQRILLHFGAVDWDTTVWVNGQKLGRHLGGYDPFSFDVTPHLKKEGAQEVVVGVFDPTDQGKQPIGKQTLNPRGIWYTPTTGIWQTVWLEPVPAEAAVAGLELTPDVDGGALSVTVTADGASTAGARVRIIARDNGREVATAEGKAGEKVRLPVPDAALWSPENPRLYDLRVELLRDGKLVDGVDSYFAMRKISLGKDEKGITRIFLNNKPYFQLGLLDQGFWPDGIYTAPTDEALRWDIEFTKALGYNMIRKHIKVEPARWYYWTDKLGVLVWQDVVSPGTKPLEGEEARRQHEHELRRMIETCRNSPSIVMWVVWNESWGQYDTERLTAWVRTLDPSRLVNSVSGWVDKNVGDVIDTHRYPGPKSPKPEPKRAAVLGEFGGLGLAIPGHLWQENTFSYQTTDDKEQLTRWFEHLMRRVYELKESPGLSAIVYTQTTDVEGENNGLVTYDRAVEKMDRPRVVKANRGDLPPVEVTPVVATAEKEPAVWKYTFTKPPDNWTAPDFDDSGWQSGPAGFGDETVTSGPVRTAWKNKEDIWLRRHIELPDPSKFADVYFLMNHGERTFIFVNGIRAGRENGDSEGYVQVPMSSQAQAGLRAGKNLFAVHSENRDKGQFIDLGLVSIRQLGAGDTNTTGTR